MPAALTTATRPATPRSRCGSAAARPARSTRSIGGGDTIYRLANFKRGGPPADLFKVPADYKARGDRR